MSKRSIILVAMLFASIVGFVAFVFSHQVPTGDGESGELSKIMIGENTGTTNDKTLNPRYVQYSASAFNSVASNRRVLFFYASWCPTCRPADISFTQNANDIPEDITLIRVNYNDPETDQEEKDLATKYEITYQHTFVQIDSEGNEITKWNGGQLNELLSNVK